MQVATHPPFHTGNTIREVSGLAKVPWVAEQKGLLLLRNTDQKICKIQMEKNAGLNQAGDLLIKYIQS